MQSSDFAGKILGDTRVLSEQAGVSLDKGVGNGDDAIFRRRLMEIRDS